MNAEIVYNDWEQVVDKEHEKVWERGVLKLKDRYLGDVDGKRVWLIKLLEQESGDHWEFYGDGEVHESPYARLVTDVSESQEFVQWINEEIVPDYYVDGWFLADKPSYSERVYVQEHYGYAFYLRNYEEEMWEVHYVELESEDYDEWSKIEYMGSVWGPRGPKTFTEKAREAAERDDLPSPWSQEE